MYEISSTIIKNRYGQIKVEPGFDGEYGIPEIDKKRYGKIRPQAIIKNIQKVGRISCLFLRVQDTAKSDNGVSVK